MKTTDERTRFIPQHVEGHFLDVYSQPVEDFMKAVKFNREDDLAVWLLGRYGPDDPQNVRVITVTVTYTWEENTDEHLPEAN